MTTTQITADQARNLFADDGLEVLVVTADGTADLHPLSELEPALGWDDNPIEHGDDDVYPSELRDSLHITGTDVARALLAATDAHRTSSFDEAAAHLTGRANRALAAHQGTL